MEEIALYSEIFFRVSILSKFPKKWVPGVIFHEEFEKNGVRLPKSKHPILVGIITLRRDVFIEFQNFN